MSFLTRLLSTMLIQCSYKTGRNKKQLMNWNTKKIPQPSLLNNMYKSWEKISNTKKTFRKNIRYVNIFDILLEVSLKDSKGSSGDIKIPNPFHTISPFPLHNENFSYMVYGQKYFYSVCLAFRLSQRFFIFPQNWLKSFDTAYFWFRSGSQIWFNFGDYHMWGIPSTFHWTLL